MSERGFQTPQMILERKGRAVDWVEAHRVCVTWYAGVSGNPDYWVFRLNRIRYEGPTWLSAVEAAMERSK